MPNKSDNIRDLLEATNLTNREIAEVVGCLPAYVRVVQQRLVGGGTSAAEKKYVAAFIAKHGVQLCAHKYRTIPEFKAKHDSYRRRKRALQEA